VVLLTLEEIQMKNMSYVLAALITIGAAAPALAQDKMMDMGDMGMHHRMHHKMMMHHKMRMMHHKKMMMKKDDM
jgi:hypothetical protein